MQTHFENPSFASEGINLARTEQGVRAKHFSQPSVAKSQTHTNKTKKIFNSFILTSRRRPAQATMKLIIVTSQLLATGLHSNPVRFFSRNKHTSLISSIRLNVLCKL